MAKKKRKQDGVVHIRMNPEIKEKLEAVAEAQKRPFSNMCAFALEQWAKEHG